MSIRALALCAAALITAACGHGGSESPSSAAALPRAIGGSPDQPPVGPIIPGSALRGQRAVCIDAELRRRNLNDYGDPLGTIYPAGSPLYNAVTGITADRQDYVLRRYPDIGTRCSRAPMEEGR